MAPPFKRWELGNSTNPHPTGERTTESYSVGPNRPTSPTHCPTQDPSRTQPPQGQVLSPGRVETMASGQGADLGPLSSLHSADLEPSGIVNLSQRFTIRPHHSDLLKKGLTFVPTPDKTPLDQLEEGVHKFSRSVKIRNSYWFSHTNHSDVASKFHVPSNYNPHPGTYPPEIDELDIILRQTFRSLSPKTNLQSNLSRPELKALEELKNDTSIVIKKADKGSAIVVMDRTDYVFEAERQLGVDRHYRPIHEPLLPQNCSTFNAILDEMLALDHISSKEYNYLQANPDARNRIFYLLPKIHKEVNKWTIPSRIPPGRPIVSDVNSESYNIAQFIDFHLAPYSTSHPAYVKNTYDFLSKLDSVTTNNSALLISLDVDSLYTNIDNEMGIQAVTEAFATDPKPIHPFIIQLLKFSLETNDFEFNGRYYLQISGTAMGKKFAPHYADITMAFWEKEHLKRCPKQPTLYLRYLDDIFMIWEHSTSDFDNMFQILNTAHPNITLKSNVQTTELEFLDVLVFKGRKFESTGRFDTKVFFKPTDSHALLHKNSFHPKHTFAGIIKSQLIRFARICTHEEDFDKASQTLFNALRDRGYSSRFLRTIKHPVRSQYFPGPMVVGMRPCGADKCSVCMWVEQSTHLETPIGNIRLTSEGTCATPAAIYALGCEQCPGLIYVGQTMDLRSRILNHKSNIKRKAQTKVAKHFHEVHSLNDVFVTILEIPSTRGDKLRSELLKLEKKWIHKLQAVSRGLNSEDESPGQLEIPFVLTYGPAASTLISEAQNWLDHWNETPLAKGKQFSIIRAHGRNKNLSQVLVRAALPEQEEDLAPTSLEESIRDPPMGHSDPKLVSTDPTNMAESDTE